LTTDADGLRYRESGPFIQLKLLSAGDGQLMPVTDQLMVTTVPRVSRS
jgi:hypothetical protein